jgi:hypothetical protein
MYSDKGWLDKYLKNRDKYIAETPNELKISRSAVDTDEVLLYEMIQPTGFIYGHPLYLPEIKTPKIEKLSSQELIKLSMTESLLLCSKLFDKSELSQKQMLDEIKHFYKFLFPEFSGNIFYNLFYKKSTQTKKVENFIEKQLSLPTSFDNFWASFFLNSLLFVDIIYFSIWLRNKNLKINASIKEERENVFMIILQIISIAINVDNKLEENEIQFYNLILQSSKLSKENYEIAKEYLHYPPKLSNIHLNNISSWLLKKYILEIAVIAVWADKDVEAYELKFLRDLTHKLGLSQEELNDSLMAVESFVLNNWQRVPYLQGKKSFELVSNRFIGSLKKTIESNKKKLGKEFSESKELMALLTKSVKSDLSAEESEKMKKQILDILKTIPMLVIVLLPGSFITLPLLLKIIPKNLLYPSAYLDENETDIKNK